MSDVDTELERIASYLIDQREEPWPDQEVRRVHYWRDKAIKSANDLRKLKGNQ